MKRRGAVLGADTEAATEAGPCCPELRKMASEAAQMFSGLKAEGKAGPSESIYLPLEGQSLR